MCEKCSLFNMSNLFCLDFIQNSDAEHIRGTECDQKILSRKESKGQVGSIIGAHLEQRNHIVKKPCTLVS